MPKENYPGLLDLVDLEYPELLDGAVRKTRSYKGLDQRKTDVRLPQELLRTYSKPIDSLSAVHIIVEWSLIFGCIFLWFRFGQPLFYPLFVIAIASRQHALAVLIHEASHFHLFSNRKTNDIVGELFLAWPLFVSMFPYRTNHFLHHRHLNSIKDPDWIKKQNSDWRMPQSPMAFVLKNFKTMLGGGVIYRLHLLLAPKTRPENVVRKSKRRVWLNRLRLTVTLACVTGLVFFGFGKALLLCWVIPWVSGLTLLLRLRAISEHVGMSPEVSFGGTRTVHAGLLDRLIFVPKNSGYHIEHHMYPSIYFHYLPQTHVSLMQNPEYKREASVFYSFWSVMKSCIRKA